MTHTQDRRNDRRHAGLPEDGRDGMLPWGVVKWTGQPGDRGVTRSGRVRTVPKPKNKKGHHGSVELE